MTRNCIICFAQEHQVSFEVMLREFGAVAIWNAQKVHDEEQHEKQEVKA